MDETTATDNRISWAEMLDVLTDSERRGNTILDKPSAVEREVLSVLRRENLAAQFAIPTQSDYDLEIYQPENRTAVCVRDHSPKVHLGQIEKFLKFLRHSREHSFTGGLFVSTSGFTPSVYTYLREEKVSNLRLAILRENRLIRNSEQFDLAEEREQTVYIGVFTCKGGVGKTTIAAHLAGAFALNGYDAALLDLDRQQNLRKLLGAGVELPAIGGKKSATLSVFNPEDWDETAHKNIKIVVCDCNPEFDANPADFIRNFDHCLIPTTLNPLGINQDADVVRRTYEEIRRVNLKANLFVLINNFHVEEVKRNALLNQTLKEQFEALTEDDPRAFYVDPREAAIRYSKQLLYWGFHLFENAKPQLAFRAVGGYCYPRLDFLKLADYLEFQTQIQKAKAKFFTA